MFANDNIQTRTTSFLVCSLNAGIPTVLNASIHSSKRVKGDLSIVLKTSKLCFLIKFRMECERRESAEKYPKNFALIRLAEKAALNKK